MIEFGEYCPDCSEFNNPGVTQALNVLPGNQHYEPFPTGTAWSSNMLAETSRGSLSTRSIDEAGDVFNFVGTPTAIYNLVSGTFEDVSKAGGYNGGSEDIRWDFTQVGNVVIATNWVDNIQYYDLGNSSLFADLGGTPPKAKYVAKIGEFLICAYTYDVTDEYQPQRVRWAGIGTIDSWTVSASTQADYQDLDNTGGWITGLIGGEYGGLIFQERKITRMTYVGSPLVFQFDEVKSANGAIDRGGIINVGDFVAYIGQDGFYMFDGQTSIPIGANKVDKTFFADFNMIDRLTLRAFLYPQKQIIGWSYRSNGSAADAGLNDYILFYNYSPNAQKRWSIATLDASDVFVALSEGWTLDELDDFPPGSQTIESLPYSLDSDVYKGGVAMLAYMDENNQLCTLDSAAADATVRTGYYQIAPNKRTTVTLMRPFVQGIPTTQTCTIDMLQNLSDAALTTTGPITPTTSGFCPVRASARYHNFEVSTTGDFNFIMGYSVVVNTSLGRR